MKELLYIITMCVIMFFAFNGVKPVVEKLKNRFNKK